MQYGKVTSPSRVELVCLLGILLLLFSALSYQAWRIGITVDEPGHLISSHFYWHGHDSLKPGDMPPLIKLTGGWPSMFFKLPIPYDYPDVWNSQQEAPIAAETMVRLGRDRTRLLFFFSRMALFVFPLLSAALLWIWGRQLFSPPAGLILALLFTVEPTVLGHGSLFKNDHAAAFTFFFFWYSAWRFWREPTNTRIAMLALSLVLATSAKMSLLILVGIGPALLAVRLWRTPLRAITAVAATFTVLYLGLLALFQFDVRTLTSADLDRAVYRGMPHLFAAASNLFRVLPLPRLLWEGCTELFFSNAAASPVYLLGDLYTGGHPYYFLIALALKLQHGFQALLLLGLARIGWLIWQPGHRINAIFMLLPPVLYVGLASLSTFQLGLRLIMPAFPFAMLIAGAGVFWLLQSRRYAPTAVLLAWIAFASISVYPHGITFFNLLAGGPDQGFKYLADSNLDWGQALPDTAEFCRTHGIKKIRLAYFGLDIPRHYFSENEMELIAPPWEDKYAKGLVWKPEPGYYAISASLLPGFLFQTKYKDYYDNFRKMEPIGRPGHAIFVYKVEARPPDPEAGN